jgi:hypothetical protein
MMGRNVRVFEPIQAVTMEDVVPPDHFYRHLERSLDLSAATYERVSTTSAQHVSLSDPDVVPVKHHNGDRVKLGYHDHYVVDGGTACGAFACGG